MSARDLAARLEHAAATYDAILRKLTVLYSKGLLDLENEPEVHMEGASNLFAVDLHLTNEKDAGAVPRAGREEADSGTAGPVSGKARGRTGGACRAGRDSSSMGELSLIGVPVMLPSGMSAVIAVLGPMRMNYGRVISAVQHVGQAFGSA